MPIRGRHQSTCNEGRRSIAAIKAIAGVKSVVIGMSQGGKSIGKGKTGMIKLQRPVAGGFKALLQSSKGVQELFIQVEPGKETVVKLEIEYLFS